MIASWFSQDMEECGLDEDGKAPTHIGEAYEWFKDYCIDQGIHKQLYYSNKEKGKRPTLIVIKKNLKWEQIGVKYTIGPKSPNFTFRQKED